MHTNKAIVSILYVGNDNIRDSNSRWGNWRVSVTCLRLTKTNPTVQIRFQCKQCGLRLPAAVPIKCSY